MTGEAKLIEPENPKRLRELIDALGVHMGNTVLRVEVQFAPSTDGDEPAATVVVTHSMGPQRELELAPVIGKMIATALGHARDAMLNEQDATREKGTSHG